MNKLRIFAAATLAALATSSSAGAFAVVDVSRLAAMATQLTQVADLIRQVTTAERLIRNASQRLRSGRLLQGSPLLSLQRLTADVRIVNYRFDTIAQQYDRLFPDRQAIENTSAEDMTVMAESWDTELQGSALVAARAQTTVSELEQSARASEALLAASSQATDEDQGSQLAALQALVQMLGVVGEDLTRLASVLAATERLNAGLAARDSAAERMVEERHRQLRDNYGRERRVPPVDARMLRGAR